MANNGQKPGGLIDKLHSSTDEVLSAAKTSPEFRSAEHEAKERRVAQMVRTMQQGSSSQKLFLTVNLDGGSDADAHDCQRGHSQWRKEHSTRFSRPHLRTATKRQPKRSFDCRRCHGKASDGELKAVWPA